MLKEAGVSGVREGAVSVGGSGFEAEADWTNLKSPETYVGYDRTENFTSPDAAKFDQRRTYRAPSRLALNQWSLAGRSRETVAGGGEAQAEVRRHIEAIARREENPFICGSLAERPGVCPPLTSQGNAVMPPCGRIQPNTSR